MPPRVRSCWVRPSRIPPASRRPKVAKIFGLIGHLDIPTSCSNYRIKGKLRCVSAEPAAGLSIGEVSRRTGSKIETIRYYERIQIVPAPPVCERAPGLRPASKAHTDLHPAAPANSASPLTKSASCSRCPRTTASGHAPRCARSRLGTLPTYARKSPIYAPWSRSWRRPLSCAMPASSPDVR